MLRIVVLASGTLFDVSRPFCRLNSYAANRALCRKTSSHPKPYRSLESSQTLSGASMLETLNPKYLTANLRTRVHLQAAGKEAKEAEGGAKEDKKEAWYLI